MCGIAAIFNIKGNSGQFRSTVLEMARRIRHRGPDWSGIYVGRSAVLAHERLSIVDPASGKQPLFSPDRKTVLAVNGEIYNHQEIRREYAGKYTFSTGSDCEVILALYRDKGIGFLEDLNGIFAFALYDEENNDFLIARDPIGVIPLYIGKDSGGRISVVRTLWTINMRSAPALTCPTARIFVVVVEIRYIGVSLFTSYKAGKINPSLMFSSSLSIVD